MARQTSEPIFGKGCNEPLFSEKGVDVSDIFKFFFARSFFIENFRRRVGEREGPRGREGVWGELGNFAGGGGGC